MLRMPEIPEIPEKEIKLYLYHRPSINNKARKQQTMTEFTKIDCNVSADPSSKFYHPLAGYLRVHLKGKEQPDVTAAYPEYGCVENYVKDSCGNFALNPDGEVQTEIQQGYVEVYAPTPLVKFFSNKEDTNEDYKADALRYRWLKEQKRLELVSDGSAWFREDGTRFLASHRLASDHTQYPPEESLDLMIDAAIKFQKEQA